MAAVELTTSTNGLITVTAGQQTHRDLNADRLETAWLLHLEHPTTVAVAVALRDQHGCAGDSIRYALAARCLHDANITI